MRIVVACSIIFQKKKKKLYKTDFICFCFIQKLLIQIIWSQILRQISIKAIVKKLIEKYRECHNHKPQRNPDTKRKSKRDDIDMCRINKQMYEKHIEQLSFPQAS